MRTILSILVLLVASMGFLACAAKATRADCSIACQKKADFEKAASPKPAADPAAEAEKGFTDKLAALQKERDEALAAIDKELQDKLAAVKPAPKGKAKKGKPAKDEEEKAKLNTDYAAMKDATAKEYEGKVSAIEQEKAEAGKAAKAKAEADAKAAMDRTVNLCADQCVNDGTKKSITDCRSQAANAGALSQCGS